jgi:hypothetical protein
MDILGWKVIWRNKQGTTEEYAVLMDMKMQEDHGLHRHAFPNQC